MARLRYNGLAGTLDASLSDSATSVTFAAKLTHAGGNVPTIAGTDYIPLALLDGDGLCVEIVHLTAYTAEATTGTIARGKEGTAAVAHDNGASFVNGPTALDIAPRAARASRTAGAVSVTSTSFVAVDTGTDLTVTAEPSDILLVSLVAYGQPPANQYLLFDVATMVSGSPVNYVSGGAGNGVIGWAIANGSGDGSTGAAAMQYVVQSGDLSSGQVTLRLVTRVTGGTATVYATDASRLFWNVVNLGQ
jgi:hypothetical protein